MIRITVPIDKALHAHNSGGWRTKAAAVKAARTLGRLLASQAPNRAIKGRAIVRYTFIVPDRHRRDTVNLMQSCKPYIDGVVDAKMISGDHWEVLDVDAPTVVVGAKLEAMIEFRSA